MKLTKILLPMAAAAFLFVGCGTKDPEANLAPEKCEISGVEAPLWVCGNLDSISKGDKKYASASAPMSKLGREFSRKQALSKARANMAEDLKSDVISQVQEEAAERQIDDNVTVNRISEQVTKQIAALTLKGTSQASSWEDKVGKELYVLISIPKANIDTEIEKAFNSAN
ncbi:LPP20 family lipoprotein [Arcobacter porcinus]|uniref:LPP20 lipoprotein n=1 Tax=Arcobacter porcinus TaxID=1935204 RepID=A0ABX2YDJ7_9BACT|nr:LPP20 family lipoprotein [Arcobacter porcinus]OCL82848.1 LPP20 lipoprotein precursor [Arcobacter porcinus]OCL85047.1 LPP20 lipoprotein precursor [Arcobacter porcinus]OCL93067.1 LPP20 lipoprotein precursor [Arcobacter porcinus]